MSSPTADGSENTFQKMEEWLEDSKKEKTEEGCNLLSSFSI
jgi:hypothetical protein